MAADICPTVTASDAHEYRTQMEHIAEFVTRVHIDLCDGHFAPTRTIGTDQVWWPGNVRADLHVMYDKPFTFAETFIALGPQLVIVHAEAEGDFRSFAETLRRHGVEVGVALLPATQPEVIRPALELIDHVLIFSGNLGHQGNSYADLVLLDKVKSIKALKQTVEIGWDGGVNDQNAAKLIEAGIDVLNVGSFIQQAEKPVEAYAKLKVLTVG